MSYPRLAAMACIGFGIFAHDATTSLVMAASPEDQAPIRCTACAGWNAPIEPYPIAPDTWFVGTRGLGAVLIADPAGLVLIDGGLPQSAAHILDNVRKLGFESGQIRWVLNSHAHFDHAGGIAALARLTGAQVAAGARGVVALQTGLYHPDDPQAGFGEAAGYPGVESVRAVEDGEVIALGALRITAVATPGHAPGGMSWTWPACDDAGNCRNVVYLDSLNAVSTDDYRFTDHPALLGELQGSIERVRALPCDVAMAAHPDQLPAADADPAASQCARYADAAARRLEKRLQTEAAATP